ncbi:PAAR domain-containing protein [Cupriavidus basilensis]
MKELAYEDDDTSHGGKILSGSDRIQVRGRRAARIGDIVSCPIHGNNKIVEAAPARPMRAWPLARDGDRTQCGSILIAAGAAQRFR